MPLTYVLDEHLRGPLWHLLGRHSQRGVDVIDVTRVGDPEDLVLGTPAWKWGAIHWAVGAHSATNSLVHFVSLTLK